LSSPGGKRGKKKQKRVVGPGKIKTVAGKRWRETTKVGNELGLGEKKRDGAALVYS